MTKNTKHTKFKLYTFHYGSYVRLARKTMRNIVIDKNEDRQDNLINSVCEIKT